MRRMLVWSYKRGEKETDRVGRSEACALNYSDHWWVSLMLDYVHYSIDYTFK